jgi:hypothetical protein
MIMTTHDNEARAARAADILRSYAEKYSDERRSLDEQVLSDLLTDLAHYCDWYVVDLSKALYAASNHYAKETTSKDPQTFTI